MMILYMNNIFERINLLKGYYQDFFLKVFHMGISVNEHVIKLRKRLLIEIGTLTKVCIIIC